MTSVMHVLPGPWLLHAPFPDLDTHRSVHGDARPLNLEDLIDVVESCGLRGRGGAAFPFATKLRATAASRTRRRHVVVNLSEGEPASLKDLALTTRQPHLILDGASLASHALGARDVHLVLPSEHPASLESIRNALRERQAEDRAARRHWHLHSAAPRFVAGEASAVTELIEGRTNLPVTSWEPAAVSGLRGEPTLLSNGETYAQLAALALSGPAVPGTEAEPGTRLLSIRERSGMTRVAEVPHGTPWHDVLRPEELSGPVLLGGYHGIWASAATLERLTVSHTELSTAGLALGAGVVLPLSRTDCPLRFTDRVARYLAGQSAGRCGPCFRGLPALVTAFARFLDGGPLEPIEQLAGLVSGRGACAHPTGTARLIRSALTAFPDEVAAHSAGDCAAPHCATEELTLAGAQ
ncbi:MAG TPA: NADH-ubiquinone oxidoreductase-F iron-sulfur binding region domain-containing protein [Marmoricola sp.]|nr:NADH-ubiquinone oxidoreductase-F iron-sulfur binding region domain-containing protein [Marmoricola sp.]